MSHWLIGAMKECIMTTERSIAKVRTLRDPAPGQFGPDHTVVEVIRPSEWKDADPFILLMDDRVDGTLRAGPHPHAGFETVTFLVHGDMPAEQGDSAGLRPGDVEWTTAGSGIVHGPDRPIEGRMRVLQLWLTLPQAERWTAPDHFFVRREDALVRHEPGATVHVYSGKSGTLVSPTRNRVPVTLVDVALEAGAAVTQEVPASSAGFFYVLEGEARIGQSAEPLVPGQVAWLDRPPASQWDDPTDRETIVRIENAGATPLRVLFYAGERQDTPIAWYGPFIGDTRADLARSFERYQAGTFLRV